MAAPMPHTELVLHPVRLRILRQAAKEPVTAKILAAKMPDIPQATLYRSIKLLAEHGVLQVVSERTVNGIIESTYKTRPGATHLTREQFAEIPPAEHSRLFAMLFGELSAAFDSYFSRPDYDTTEEGMTYFHSKLELTNEQRRQLRVDLIELIRGYANEPQEGARSTTLSITLLPTEDQ